MNRTVNPSQPTSLRDYVELALSIAMEEQLDATEALTAAAACHADPDAFAKDWDRMSALVWAFTLPSANELPIRSRWRSARPFQSWR